MQKVKVIADIPKPIWCQYWGCKGQCNIQVTSRSYFKGVGPTIYFPVNSGDLYLPLPSKLTGSGGLYVISFELSSVK